LTFVVVVVAIVVAVVEAAVGSNYHEEKDFDNILEEKPHFVDLDCYKSAEDSVVGPIEDLVAAFEL
jgi:hypothetical protein